MWLSWPKLLVCQPTTVLTERWAIYPRNCASRGHIWLPPEGREDHRRWYRIKTLWGCWQRSEATWSLIIIQWKLVMYQWNQRKTSLVSLLLPPSNPGTWSQLSTWQRRVLSEGRGGGGEPTRVGWWQDKHFLSISQINDTFYKKQNDIKIHN